MQRFVTSSVCIGFVLGMLMTPLESPALFGAGDVVYDPANHVENIVQVAQSAEMVLRQAEAIRNQLTMIAHQAQSLATLDFSSMSGMMTALRSTTTLLGQTNGLTYRVGRINQQFDTLYPTIGAAVPGSDFLHKVRGWNTQTRRAIRDTMRSQAIFERQEGSGLLILGAIGAADRALGHLQAQQANNQMTGATNAQLAQMHELMATSERMRASEFAMEAAMTEASIANAERWMHNFTVSTDVTPKAMPKLSY